MREDATQRGTWEFVVVRPSPALHRKSDLQTLVVHATRWFDARRAAFIAASRIASALHVRMEDVLVREYEFYTPTLPAIIVDIDGNRIPRNNDCDNKKTRKSKKGARGKKKSRARPGPKRGSKRIRSAKRRDD